MEQDRRLDRRVNFDDRSKKFPIQAILPKRAYKKPRSYLWSCKGYLDQGTEGACVGFGWSHELIARPKAIKTITESDAFKIYRYAQTIDEWDGENYSGTSVLAGVKAVQHFWPKYIRQYRWGFDLEDMIATIGYYGPVVLGVNWYRDMYTPDKDGVIKVSGPHVGGHCILARGVQVKKERFLLHNSWGKDWGINGSAWISFSDMASLLSNGGEQCIPVRRGQ